MRIIYLTGSTYKLPLVFAGICNGTIRIVAEKKFRKSSLPVKNMLTVCSSSQKEIEVINAKYRSDTTRVGSNLTK
jgi:hypothetical protein